MKPADLRAVMEGTTPGEWSAVTGSRLCHLHAPAGPVAHRLLLVDAEAIAALHNLAPALLALWEAAGAYECPREAKCSCRLCAALAALRATGERT